MSPSTSHNISFSSVKWRFFFLKSSLPTSQGCNGSQIKSECFENHHDLQKSQSIILMITLMFQKLISQNSPFPFIENTTLIFLLSLSLPHPPWHFKNDCLEFTKFINYFPSHRGKELICPNIHLEHSIYFFMYLLNLCFPVFFFFF